MLLLIYYFRAVIIEQSTICKNDFVNTSVKAFIFVGITSKFYACLAEEKKPVLGNDLKKG